MQALTKYQSGGSDVLMGAVITRDQALIDRSRWPTCAWGWASAPTTPTW
jgi:cystathionine beta-lyase